MLLKGRLGALCGPSRSAPGRRATLHPQMWDPLLKKELSDGISLRAQIVKEAPAVYCILQASPQLLSPDAYVRSQASIDRLYRDLPHVALAAQADLADSEQVKAWIAAAKEPPVVIALERQLDGAHAARLQGRTFELTTAAGEFLALLVAACRDLASRCSAQFATLWRLIDAYERSESDLQPHLRALTRLAEDTGYAVPASVAVANRLLAATERVHVQTLLLERARLEQDVVARASSGAISPRSVLELAIEHFDRRRTFGEDADAAIAECRRVLGVPDPPMIEGLLDLIRDEICDRLGDYIGRTVGRRGDEVDRPEAYGAAVVRLAELAPLLNIDMNRYPTVRLYVHHCTLIEVLRANVGGDVLRPLMGAVERLEDDLCHALATTRAERAMAAWLPVVGVVDSLRAGHVGFDPMDLDILVSLSAAELVDELESLGVAIPPDWRSRAEDVDDSIGQIVDYADFTEHRGRQMAREIRAELLARELDSMVLVCEGYLQNALADGFGTNVSYTMLAPTAR